MSSPKTKKIPIKITFTTNDKTTTPKVTSSKGEKTTKKAINVAATTSNNEKSSSNSKSSNSKSKYRSREKSKELEETSLNKDKPITESEIQNQQNKPSEEKDKLSLINKKDEKDEKKSDTISANPTTSEKINDQASMDKIKESVKETVQRILNMKNIKDIPDNHVQGDLKENAIESLHPNIPLIYNSSAMSTTSEMSSSSLDIESEPSQSTLSLGMPIEESKSDSNDELSEKSKETKLKGNRHNFSSSSEIPQSASQSSLSSFTNASSSAVHLNLMNSTNSHSSRSSYGRRKKKLALKKSELSSSGRAIYIPAGLINPFRERHHQKVDESIKEDLAIIREAQKSNSEGTDLSKNISEDHGEKSDHG